MSPNTSGGGILNPGKHNFFDGINQKLNKQTNKEKLGKYLSQRSSSKPGTLNSIRQMDTTGNESRMTSKLRINESLTKLSDRKMKIEIKSREIVQVNENLEAKLSIVKRLPSNHHITDGSGSPRFQHRDTYRSPPPQEREKADKEDLLTRFGVSPRRQTPEKKFREESTRPSKQPIYSIKWSASFWQKADELIRVDRILGQGSFAKVYQGFDLVSKSIVAIKILDKRKLTDMGFQKMAEKELEIMQAVSYPNICKFEKMIEDHKRVSSYNTDIHSNGTLWIYDFEPVLPNQASQKAI